MIITKEKLLMACDVLVSEKISYQTMDCQKAFEEALIRCGVPAKECDLSGSNRHYRNMKWTGTPERLVELLGVKEVPAGFAMFIVLDDGKEPAEYRGDGYGNASHMGWYCGKGKTFNSSYSRGGVEYSTKFKGRKAVRNGGWNMCGWPVWVDCGLTAEQIAALENDANFNTNVAASVDSEGDTGTETAAAAPVFRTKYARYRWQYGDKGNGVRAVQTALNRLGYGLSVDGIFGPATRAAVIDIQKAHNLVADGVVGEYTWDAMITDINTVA